MRSSGRVGLEVWFGFFVLLFFLVSFRVGVGSRGFFWVEGGDTVFFCALGFGFAVDGLGESGLGFVRVFFLGVLGVGAFCSLSFE